jgi:hypothetical protein
VFVYLDLIKANGESEVIAFGRLKLSHHQQAQAPYETARPAVAFGREPTSSPAAGEFVPLAIAMTPVSRVVAPGRAAALRGDRGRPAPADLVEIRLDPAPRITLQLGGATGSRIDLPLAP